MRHHIDRSTGRPRSTPTPLRPARLCLTGRGRVTGFLLVLGTVAAMIACDRGMGPPAVGVPTDSAGIEIVRNSGPGLWGGEPGWSFEEDLRIGGLGGPIEGQFGSVPGAGIVVGDEGAIYILDQQVREVRAFDRDGNYIRTIGRPGEGPGEFGEVLMAIMVGPHGGLVVPDLANQSVQRFDVDGEYMDSQRLQVVAGEFGAFVPIRWDRLSDGRLVAQIKSISVEFLATGAGGRAPQPDVIIALNETGVPPDTVLTLGIGETLSGLGEGIPQVRLFAPEPVWSSGGTGKILKAQSNEFRLSVHGEDGTLIRIIERDVPPHILTDGDKADIVGAITRRVGQEVGAELQAELSSSGGGLGALGEFVTFNDTYPLVIQTLFGPEGTIWARGVQAPERAIESLTGIQFDLMALGGSTLSVFEAGGVYLGDMELPDRFQPALWHEDALYGIQLDEYDVQSIVRLRLIRN